jgi:RNA polymerase sigma-70 factor (ECF subfamily)
MDFSKSEHIGERVEPSGETQDEVEAREDAQLLQAIAEEDQQALAILYRRRGDLVYSVLVRMLGNSAEAQEVLQDTFIRLWRRAKEFDADRSSATAWLLLFARGLALDKLRSRSRRTAIYSAYEREVAALEVEEITAAHRLESDELSGVCQAALNRLPAPQSRALQLAFFRGWTHEEIARSQGEALGTVKARIRRGLLALRQTLKEYYG